MNLEIEIDKRNTGKFYQKNKGVKSSFECRRQAILDITKDCGDGKFFSKNYISIESQVLDNCKKILIILELNTTIY